MTIGAIGAKARASGEWMSFRRIAERYGVTPDIVGRWARDGLVTVLRVPNTKTLILVSSVEELNQSSLSPARTTTA